MDQISMEDLGISKTDEETLRESIEKEINEEDFTKYLSVERLKNGDISIKAKSVIVAQLCFKKTISSYMKVRVSGRSFFEKTVCITSVDAEWLKINFDSISDIVQMSTQLALLFMNVLKTLLHESYGCCSRYLECSNAKRCVNPNKVLAEGCQYKTNLEQGRIFYGINKNA